MSACAGTSRGAQHRHPMQSAPSPGGHSPPSCWCGSCHTRNRTAVESLTTCWFVQLWPGSESPWCAAVAVASRLHLRPYASPEFSAQMKSVLSVEKEALVRAVLPGAGRLTLDLGSLCRAEKWCPFCRKNILDTTAGEDCTSGAIQKLRRPNVKSSARMVRWRAGQSLETILVLRRPGDPQESGLITAEWVNHGGEASLQGRQGRVNLSHVCSSPTGVRAICFLSLT